MRPDVTVVIANWNTTWWVLNRSAFVVRQNDPWCKIVIVDQGSKDVNALKAFARDHRDTVSLILLRKNYGPGKAWNDGIRLAGSEYICILNSDAWLAPGSIEAMLKTLNSDDRIGLVGPMADGIGGPQHVPDPVEREDFEITDVVMPFVCVVFRRALMEKVGMMAERFYRGGFEDTEYCDRVRAAGYRTVVCGSAFCRHAMNQAYHSNKVNVVEAQSEMARLLNAHEAIVTL